MSDKKPLLLFTSFGIHGHFNPTAQIAEEMIKRGYDVVYVIGHEFEAKIKQIGAEWVPTLSAFDLVTPEFQKEIVKLEPSLRGFLYSQENIFLKPMPERAQIIQNTLESLRQREPDRQIIVLDEALSMAIYPFKLGKPPPKGFKEFPKTICFNVIPMFLKSRDTAPFLLGIPPDCSDLPSSIRFAGCVPKKPLDPSYQYPDWWPELASSKEKKIVFVAQGTIAVNYEELVIPTLMGLADRKDLLVVAALGIRGAKLADDFQLPSNARVHDFLPYDAILELADVFVSNGGYGSLTHTVINGVPQVLSGVTEDKQEVGIRAERAGLAVNLGMRTPTPKQVAKAVDVVLSNPKYKEVALALKEENDSYDTFGIIENQILEFTESRKS